MRRSIVVLALALSLAAIAGKALAAAPTPVATVRVTQLDCTRVTARADWERLRIARVEFIFSFGSGTKVYRQSVSIDPRPARSGTVERTLANDASTPFADGDAYVQADFVDAKGALVASADSRFTVNCSAA